ncbi:MAG: type II CRISPR RNA-guided endonuclease Cas9 [Deltaproteobacteria bacterium]|nr:type II CRISPR RNA-guided endonuclease Cas9 [Deltaproteobacteria bacterium]
MEDYNFKTTLGFDIGTNSVGSAWVDVSGRDITFGVSIFPKGVEESESKRGAPKNLARRSKRSQRRMFDRRAKRLRRLRSVLTAHGLLPSDPEEFRRLFYPTRKEIKQTGKKQDNPWLLRRKALSEPLEPYELGRVLLHLSQQRGAFGVDFEEGDTESENRKEQPQKKEALARTQCELNGRTYGQMMADLFDTEKVPLKEQPPDGKFYRKPIRNRRGAYLFHADREMIRDEFRRIWTKQKSLPGKLTGLLTDDFRTILDNPQGDATWRHKGEIFGQRRTYWDTGTLSRCILEPTDLCCPLGDRYAQEFRVLETVNSIRIDDRAPGSRPLTDEERAALITALRKERNGTVERVKKALEIDKKTLRKKGGADVYRLNLENDPDREINTDWFYREIVHGVFGHDSIENLSDADRVRRLDSVNSALLKYDPASAADSHRLSDKAEAWWKLDSSQIERLLTAWKERPNPQQRMRLSRRAIINLLPYLRQGYSVTEARQHFAEDEQSGASPEQRIRYAHTVTEAVKTILKNSVPPQDLPRLFQLRTSNKATRRYIERRNGVLPPPPFIANRVARKAVYEVRRHLIHYLRKFGQKPDRVIVELARDATQPAKRRDKQLAENRQREKDRKTILESYGLSGKQKNQQDKAVERIRLWQEQKGICPYSGECIPPQILTDSNAMPGKRIEVDHIIPRSRSGVDNSFNNKLLCFADSNRTKGDRTPKEWLTAEQFEQLEQRLQHLPGKNGVNPVKWKILHKDAPKSDEDGFTNSQLSDTAYASVQICDYLRNALYDGEMDGRRRVFTTKGRFTAILRKEWGLFESALDAEWHPELAQPAAEIEPGNDRPVSRKDGKRRWDHRHHAIDAVVIAMTGPERIQELSRRAQQQELQKKESGLTPKQAKLDPPWNSFKDQVLTKLKGHVVAHRPTKRKVVGALHEDNPFGRAKSPVNRDTYLKGLYQQRVGVSKITDSSFGEIRPPSKANGEWSTGGKPVILNPTLRKQLKLHGAIDKNTRVILQTTGIPVFKWTSARAIGDPVEIKSRKDGVQRFYRPDNNHHIEILAHKESNEWTGICWSMFHAARRAKPPKILKQYRLPLVIGRSLGQLIENRDHLSASLATLYGDELGLKLFRIYESHNFIFSVSLGEIFRMRHKKTNMPGFFKVVKIEDRSITFTGHWDARGAPSKKPNDGKKNKQKTGTAGTIGTSEMVANPPRDEFSCSPAQMKDLGSEPGIAPYKVRISPLGVIEKIELD